MEVTNTMLESLYKACIVNVIKMRLQVIKFDIQESVGFVICKAMYKYIYIVDAELALLVQWTWGIVMLMIIEPLGVNTHRLGAHAGKHYYDFLISTIHHIESCSKLTTGWLKALSHVQGQVHQAETLDREAKKQWMTAR